MSHPDWGDWGAPLPADDGTGEDELYNPITYESDEPDPEGDSPDGPLDAWDPGRSGGGVPMAGEDPDGGAAPAGSTTGEPASGGTAPPRWAPSGWVPAQQATPVQRSAPGQRTAPDTPTTPDIPGTPAFPATPAPPTEPSVDPAPTIVEPIAAEFAAPAPAFPRSGPPSAPTFTPHAPPRPPSAPESPAPPDAAPWQANPPRPADLTDDAPTTIRPVTLPPAAPPPGRRDGGAWPDESWPPRVTRKARPPRWVIAAAAAVIVAAAAAGTAFALGGSPATSRAGARAGASAGASAHPAAHPAATFPPGMAPALSPAAAKAVLAQYTASNNAANARMDPGLLGGYETGSSQSIDTGSFARQKAQGAHPYPAFGPASTQLYIPVEPSAFPHWFAARVADQALGGKHQALGTQYLLFVKSSASAPWKNEDESYLLGGASAPPVSLDTEGYASTVDFKAPGLSVSPSRLAQQTATSLDGHGPVSGPGNLADTGTVNRERARLPKGTQISNSHTQTGYGIVGLRTADGGALLFYTDAAIVTFTAPHGKSFTMTIPGFYNGKEVLHWAGVRILDQLATYDPPAGHGNPRVVADYSGVQERL